MFNLFNRFTVACILLFAITTHAGLLFAEQKPLVESVELQEGVNSGVAADTQLAMNDADALAKKDSKKPVTETGPVLLVPMVLAVLALVAVSRRKES